jgi:hypothetical protein
VSSTVLYLAIVAVWAVVLVPMYLRRDTSRLMPRRTDTALQDEDDGTVREHLIDVTDVREDAWEGLREDAHSAHHPPEHDDPGSEDYEEILAEDLEDRRPRRLRRSTVIARRRRRTFFLMLTLLAAIGTVAAGLAPWWVTVPPVVLLLGHMALLRTAVGVDLARRERMLEMRAQARVAAHLAEQARVAEEAVKAEIIDLAERARARDVFDQYADGVARAVGD